MKKILLLVLSTMLFSCTSDVVNNDLQQEKVLKIETLQREGETLPDLGEGSWCEFETINEFNYIVIKGQKEEEIVSVATNCSTCRVECSYVKNLGNHVHLVSCNNGHNYYAQYCGGSWLVVSADASWSHDSNYVWSASLTPPPPPGC